ncbi:hypothetical protein PG294_04490 [Riemerella anatipestifer]|nr:DUF6705 family protein [Riemerella anatipestifer]AZZ58512.1 hypothetical protein AWB57_05380 [Riemerella anatipestifer]MBT0572885.1 hypothetical protein [Riemerella anatipestifer]MCQ4154860.1 hypothetical protein [Riemerella anatipestifer]MDD1539342.1 hypothetical protein [Riemerella anatipestifer]MDR7774819.1 hypothetical protein [Riemerella anatipestifer]
MKQFILIATMLAAWFCKSQTYTLRTYGINFPKDSYVKDTKNELPAYEGTWKGTWDGKTILITFRKVKKYLTHKVSNEYFRDMLIGKFKVMDQNNRILFDNSYLSDQDTKIEGWGFRKKDDRYSLNYHDKDICGLWGFITIYFTDHTRSRLQWNFYEGSNLITPDCPYYNAAVFPQPLPKDLVLVKQ